MAQALAPTDRNDLSRKADACLRYSRQVQLQSVSGLEISGQLDDGYESFAGVYLPLPEVKTEAATYSNVLASNREIRFSLDQHLCKLTSNHSWINKAPEWLGSIKRQNVFEILLVITGIWSISEATQNQRALTICGGRGSTPRLPCQLKQYGSAPWALIARL